MGHHDSGDLHRRPHTGDVVHPRGNRRHQFAALTFAAVLLAGCSTSAPDAPVPPSPSGSVGSLVPVEDVADGLLNALEVETYFDMDEATWKRMRSVATSLPWHLVSAAGVEQAAACIGEGAPTVVYIDDFKAPAAPYWSLVADEQSRSTRVCLFDRPGMGLSRDRAVHAPHSTPEMHADEMLAMLGALGETGPYLLVGWAYGGLVARTAATLHPDQVAGMVLVDATSPLIDGLDEPTKGENGILDTDTVANTVGEGPDMGNRPVVVLQAGQVGEDTAPDAVRTWNALQRQAATISENSVHAIVDDSDYWIPMRNPSAVVAATASVAESIRAGSATLPACPEGLAAAGVTCQGSDPVAAPAPMIARSES